VTLWYRGTGRVQFTEVTVKKGTKTLLKTDMAAIREFEEIRAALSTGGKEFQAHTVDDHGNATPLGPTLIPKPKPEGGNQQQNNEL